jgi:fatty acyl-CoA reductase
MEIGRGTITTVMGDENGLVDLMPVDIVCNALITAAWANSFMRPSNAITVYNCTSGQLNPHRYIDLGERIVKSARKNPSKYIAMYPNFKFRMNRVAHYLIELFMHFLPAILFDIILRVQGKKPIMYKIAKRVKMAQDTGEYFVINYWNFDAKNYKRMIRAAAETQNDFDEFNCDISRLDWEKYIELYMMGIRTFILKDDASSLPSARKKLRKIYIAKRCLEVFYLVAIALFFYWIWN